VEMKRRPTIGPDVVDKEHCDAFNNFSPSLTLKSSIKTFSTPPT